MRSTPRTLPLLFLLAPLAVAALLPGPCVCSEKESAAPEPPDEAQVERWLEDLGCEEFWTRREAAEALAPWVDCFWPEMAVYLGDEDLERTRMLRDLAHAAGIVPADEAAMLQSLLEEIGMAKEDGTRLAAFDKLLRFDHAGRESLQRCVRGTGARLVTVMEPFSETWITPGAGPRLQGRLEVRGGDCWQRFGWRSMSARMKLDCLGAARGLSVTQTFVSGRRSFCSGQTFGNPLLRWTQVKDGARVCDIDWHWNLDLYRFGRYELWLSAGLEAKALLAPSGSREPLKLEMNADLPASSELEGPPASVWVLPDFDDLGASDGCLDLSVTAAQNTAEPGGFLGATVKVAVPEGGESRFLLEGSLPKYAWFVVLDEDGRPACHGSWKEALSCAEQETESATAAREVAPGRPVSWNLRVPMPERPGTYRLGVCYAVGKVSHDLGQPDFPRSEDHPDAEPYTEGVLWAASELFEVAPPTPRVER
ncbi:MAG: hypothetical protein L6R28_01520 [Planctomycetes bacterium]|nr:hypothetical protein [Planctomycetota bacterium]